MPDKPEAPKPALPRIGGTVAEVLARIAKNDPQSPHLKRFVPPPPKFTKSSRKPI